MSINKLLSINSVGCRINPAEDYRVPGASDRWEVTRQAVQGTPGQPGEGDGLYPVRVDSGGGGGAHRTRGEVGRESRH